MSKKVTVKQMTLVNFKGIKSLTVDFGQVTEIRGANATGKSTIADAFNWVLFGKDAAGNADTKFGIKTVDATGKVIEKIDPEVTAILDIGDESYGNVVELRRVYSEDWVTSRGKAEPELKGHKTAYFYNGVPLKESEYKIKINSIIDEDLFRMLTNPLYFPRLDWQVQREMLLKIAGGITLEEIAAGRVEFSELLAQLSGKSLAEIKAEISARKKKIKDALDLIPARIDEVTRATPAAPDYKALEAEKTAIEQSIEVVEGAMKNAAELSRAEYTEQSEIQRQINAQKGIQQQAVFDAKQKSKEEWNNRNTATNEAKINLDAFKKTVDSINSVEESEVLRLKSEEKRLIEKITNQEDLCNTLRQKWHDENSREYNNESDVCPTCEQILPEEKRAEKQNFFEKTKLQNIESINNDGQFAKQQIELLKIDVEKIVTKIKETTKEAGESRENAIAEINRLQAFLSENPQEPYNEPKPEEITEYIKAQEQINILSKQLEDRPITSGNNTELTTKKKTLTDQLDEVKKQLGLKAIIETNEKRKDELLKEEKSLAQQKADLEKQEFTADSLVKEQMNEVERRVNLKFKLVRFKMFSKQINGGEKPDCILIGPDGAKFMDTNSAGKIAIGLDIINTLCEFNGVFAPIFVDNAEGINQILPVDSQLIKLIVTQDKQLNINI